MELGAAQAPMTLKSLMPIGDGGSSGGPDLDPCRQDPARRLRPYLVAVMAAVFFLIEYYYICRELFLVAQGLFHC